MQTLTTHGVTVTSRFVYLDETPYSDPGRGVFGFGYVIEVHNSRQRPVQIIGREWTVFDATGRRRELRANNVHGEQPVLEPDQQFSVGSMTQLITTVGLLRGRYFARFVDEPIDTFVIEIPELRLATPWALN